MMINDKHLWSTRDTDHFRINSRINEVLNVLEKMLPEHDDEVEFCDGCTIMTALQLVTTKYPLSLDELKEKYGV